MLKKQYGPIKTTLWPNEKYSPLMVIDFVKNNLVAIKIAVALFAVVWVVAVSIMSVSVSSYELQRLDPKSSVSEADLKEIREKHGIIKMHAFFEAALLPVVLTALSILFLM